MEEPQEYVPEEEAPQEKPSRNRRRRGKGEKPAQDQSGEKKEQPKREPKPKAEIRPLEKPVVTMIPDDQVEADSAAGKAQAFLKELTQLMGVEVSVDVNTDEEGNVRVNMQGDSQGILIGRRGETLDALQYLTSLQVNKGRGEYVRVTLDTEGYRARREEALIRLANRMANRAVKTGRRVSMEPMNPYERRILHATLQDHPYVTTHSEGDEPNRRVVIAPKRV